MDKDELKLKEQEIEEIENKIKEYKEKIKENEIKEKTYSKRSEVMNNVFLTCCLGPILLVIGKVFKFNDIILLITLILDNVVAISTINLSIFYFEKESKTKKIINKLNTELNENNELLLIRTNTLNELKDKSNEKENEYTNYKYKIINNSDSLTEVKTSGKTRIRKRDK